MHPLLHPRAAVELFQTHFLAQLDRVIPPESYAVKGGCNLRMLLGSPRASEDLDLDIQQVARPTLKKRVEAIEIFLRGTLAGNNIAVKSFAAAKQTDTVQRWKAELELLGQRVTTKVEFSRRGIKDKPSRSGLISRFQIRYGTEGVVLSHYGRDIALKQKFQALAGRKVTQARDVFDAAFLAGIGASAPTDLDRETLRTAAESTHAVRFHDYAGQVLPYLEQSDAEKFGSEAAWNRLKETVIGLLQSPSPGRDTPGATLRGGRR